MACSAHTTSFGETGAKTPLESRPRSYRLFLMLPMILMVWACDEADQRPRTTPVTAKVAAPITKFPLAVGENRRSLVDRDGRAFFIHGDAAWSLVVQLDPMEMEEYLEDRRMKGFNAVYVNLIEHRYSSHRPAWRNAAGEQPFSARLPDGHLDFTAPNEPYWQHVDAVIEAAAEKGMLVLAFPAYVGYALSSDDGWSEELQANGVANCGRYGAWLAQRYADRPNLIWGMGGDWKPYNESLDLTAEINALAEGLKSVDEPHLITAHSHRDRSSLDDYDQPWLDLNATYGRYARDPGATTIPARLHEDFHRERVMPFFLIEGEYENQNGMTMKALRSQAYWAILSGAAGHFYGAWPIWSFGAAKRFGDDTDVTWREALLFEGAADMVHVGDLLRSRPFERFLPDFDRRVLTAGYGEIDGNSYAAAVRATDGSSLVAYLPNRREITVDLSQISGTQAKVWWYDPRDGSAKLAGTFPTEGPQNLTPDEEGDWVLVVDDAALALAPPGNEDHAP